MRLYDFEADHFRWGSWILDQHKPAKAALESAFLIYEQGFERLGLQKSFFDVRKDNERTLAFHSRFGAVETGRNDLDVFFKYTRAQFDGYFAICVDGLELGHASTAPDVVV